MEFGQMVKVCGMAAKGKEFRPSDNVWCTVWKHRQIWKVNADNPAQVMIIGKRTVFEGEHIWLGDDEGYGFKQERSIQVYLVVRNMRENPFYVFPDQIVSEDE